jgi:hypothetical protein
MSSPRLPPEIFDYIADLLHDQRETLKRCCLVSKSWVPRTRKHFFAAIGFQSEERLKLWKKAFPDPSISPAYYTKTLFVDCPQVVVAADAEPGGWIRGFSRIVHLSVGNRRLSVDGSFSLVPFHGLSPNVKSLYITVHALPPSRMINLIFSFPLLEDLAVFTSSKTSPDNRDSPNRLLTAVQPSSLPAELPPARRAGGVRGWGSWLCSRLE